MFITNKQSPLKLQAYLANLKASIGGKCVLGETTSEDDAVIVAIDHGPYDK